jgi:hypothetical protein
MEIKAIVRTCTACPSQWEGKLENKQDIYIRYRWSHLTVQIGNTLTEAIISEPVYHNQFGLSPYEGWLSNIDMMNILTQETDYTFSEISKQYLNKLDENDALSEIDIDHILKVFRVEN